MIGHIFPTEALLTKCWKLGNPTMTFGRPIIKQHNPVIWQLTGTCVISDRNLPIGTVQIPQSGKIVSRRLGKSYFQRWKAHCPESLPKHFEAHFYNPSLGVVMLLGGRFGRRNTWRPHLLMCNTWKLFRTFLRPAIVIATHCCSTT
jgi:hypothetical protein